MVGGGPAAHARGYALFSGRLSRARRQRVGRDNVRDNLKKPGRLLLDARSPEEYEGKRVAD